MVLILEAVLDFSDILGAIRTTLKGKALETCLDSIVGDHSWRSSAFSTTRVKYAVGSHWFAIQREISGNRQIKGWGNGTDIKEEDLEDLI